MIKISLDKLLNTVKDFNSNFFHNQVNQAYKNQYILMVLVSTTDNL